jgi:hypothetical protein
MKKNNDLNIILRGVILNNEKLKNMFDFLELEYKKTSNYEDLQLFLFDLIEMDLLNYLNENQLDIFEVNITNWLYNYFEFELINVVSE